MLFIIYGLFFSVFNFQTVILRKVGLKFKLFKTLVAGGQEVVDLQWNFLLDIDEKLGEYWKCLKGVDQKRWFVKEAHL